MANSIIYKQAVKVIEYYEIEYTENEFEFDCETYQIKDFTYAELCDILNEKIDDVMISVYEGHVNSEREWVIGPHFTSAKEFFTRILCDSAFEYGYGDRDELEIMNREIDIIEE